MVLPAGRMRTKRRQVGSLERGIIMISTAFNGFNGKRGKITHFSVDEMLKAKKFWKLLSDEKFTQ
jgi:hypothetical protein